MYFPGPGNYDLNHDGTIDVCLYKGAKPSGVNALEFLEIGVTVDLTEGESGNVICYKDVPASGMKNGIIYIRFPDRIVF